MGQHPFKPQLIYGKKYGRLTAICFVDRLRQNQRWLMKCECGTTKIQLAFGIKSGRISSCGCLQQEMRLAKRGIPSTHGMTYTPEYNSWVGMKGRCYNKNNPKFRRYGARGITVCDRWLNSFENFYQDMGSRPSAKHSIDRINNNGIYEPSNCRWATYVEQNNNRGGGA